MSDARTPETPAEWQEAVDLAHGYLTIEAAKAYGLVIGGPTVNARRCEWLLEQGEARGVKPTPGCAERLARALAGAPAPR